VELLLEGSRSVEEWRGAGASSSPCRRGRSCAAPTPSAAAWAWSRCCLRSPAPPPSTRRCSWPMPWACSGREPGRTGPGRGGSHDHDHLDLQPFGPGGPAAGPDRPRRRRLPLLRDLLGPDAASGDVPLSELPTLSKATLMDSFDRAVTDPRLRRAELEAHLAGPAPDRPYLGRYRLFSTAGTPACAACSWTTWTSSRPGSAPACGAWPPGGWGRGPGWP
jgi:hypothetical protein